MSGVLYGRVPDAQNTDPIHLWERDDDTLRTSCGEHACEIINQSNSSYLVQSESGAKKEIRVIQQESFKQGNDQYCDDCLAAHPKASKFA